jgi:hypothetical protein
MPEVNTRFEQLLHCDSGQWPSFVDCIRAGSAATRIEPAYAGIMLPAISFQLPAFSFSLPFGNPLGTRYRKLGNEKLKAGG